MAAAEKPVEISVRFPDLAGKTAIVTGASRGIGRAIAHFLGAQGMKIVLTARSVELGQEVAASLEAKAVDCVWCEADLSAPDGAKRVFELALERFGDIHLLVNNAANKWSTPFLKLDEEAYQKSFESNVRMVYGLSHLVANHMVDRKIAGAIVNISSVGGLRPHRGTVGYDASKGAMDNLTRSMAIELAPLGIRVNSVAPGFTPGPEHAKWLEKKYGSEWREKLAQKPSGIPAAREGTGDDVAALVAFLASDAATYIIGQIIYVDGGLTVQLTPPGISI